MERDLAVKCGFGLEQCQQHFSEPPEGIQATMRKAGFQVGGQRVSMQVGSIGDRHKPRYRPLSCLIASQTPFVAKCQVLRVAASGGCGKPNPYWAADRKSWFPDASARADENVLLYCFNATWLRSSLRSPSLSVGSPRSRCASCRMMCAAGCRPFTSSGARTFGLIFSTALKASTTKM